MSPALSTDVAVLKLTERIAANPALAAPLLKLLKAAGYDPTALSALTRSALTGINDALPVAPSTMMEAGTKGSPGAALSLEDYSFRGFLTAALSWGQEIVATMTSPARSTGVAAQTLTGYILANTALAPVLLNLLDAAGNNPKKLGELTERALKGINDALRVAPSTAVPAVPALDQPLSASTTEQKLRAGNGIQDDREILAKLGYDKALPEISSELLEECARTGGTVVFLFKTTVLAYQAKLNESLGEQKGRLGLNYIDDRKLATTNEEPTWINVPNTVKDDTLKLSKASALEQVPGSQTCDPMDIILMLGYNNLQAGKQMPGFRNKWTFTSQKNTLVGSDGIGIRVIVRDLFDDDGYYDVGLAPRFAPESKKV